LAKQSLKNGSKYLGHQTLLRHRSQLLLGSSVSVLARELQAVSNPYSQPPCLCLWLCLSAVCVHVCICDHLNGPHYGSCPCVCVIVASVLSMVTQTTRLPLVSMEAQAFPVQKGILGLVPFSRVTFDRKVLGMLTHIGA